MLKNKFIVFVFMMVFPLGAYPSTSIPNTNISFELPDLWEPIEKEGFSLMIKEGAKKLSLENEVTEAIDQARTYGFIKQFDKNGNKVNATMVFVVMELGQERIDVNAILSEHVAQKKQLQSVVSVKPNECPDIDLPKHSCLTQHSKRSGREVMQYHYVSQINSTYFQFSINVPNGSEIKEAKLIISTLSSSKI